MLCGEPFGRSLSKLLPSSRTQPERRANTLQLSLSPLWIALSANIAALRARSSVSGRFNSFALIGPERPV